MSGQTSTTSTWPYNNFIKLYMMFSSLLCLHSPLLYSRQQIAPVINNSQAINRLKVKSRIQKRSV